MDPSYQKEHHFYDRGSNRSYQKDHYYQRKREIGYSEQYDDSYDSRSRNSYGYEKDVDSYYQYHPDTYLDRYQRMKKYGPYDDQARYPHDYFVYQKKSRGEDYEDFEEERPRY